MNERDIDISVKSLPGPLNFESLFSRFCVRWLEQRFDDFMTDVVPKLLDDNKEMGSSRNGCRFQVEPSCKRFAFFYYNIADYV